MIAHISWFGLVDMTGVLLFVLVVAAARLVVWLEEREQPDRLDPEMVDLVARLRGHEGQKL